MSSGQLMTGILSVSRNCDPASGRRLVQEAFAGLGWLGPTVHISIVRSEGMRLD